MEIDGDALKAPLLEKTGGRILLLVIHPLTSHRSFCGT